MKPKCLPPYSTIGPDAISAGAINESKGFLPSIPIRAITATIPPKGILTAFQPRIPIPCCIADISLNDEESNANIIVKITIISGMSYASILVNALATPILAHGFPEPAALIAIPSIPTARRYDMTKTLSSPGKAWNPATGIKIAVAMTPPRAIMIPKSNTHP